MAKQNRKRTSSIQPKKSPEVSRIGVFGIGFFGTGIAYEKTREKRKYK